MDAETLDAKIQEASGSELDVLLAQREEMEFGEWLSEMFEINGIEVDGG